MEMREHGSLEDELMSHMFKCKCGWNKVHVIWNRTSVLLNGVLAVIRSVISRKFSPRMTRRGHGMSREDPKELDSVARGHVQVE